MKSYRIIGWPLRSHSRICWRPFRAGETALALPTYYKLLSAVYSLLFLGRSYFLFHSPVNLMSKPVAREFNKSEEIRKVAEAMRADGKKPRPVLIIAALKKLGIEVSSPQVSMVLKRMGFTLRRRRNPQEIAAQVRACGTTGISVDDLVAAKKFVSQFGGTDRALAAIEALRRLEG